MMKELRRKNAEQMKAMQATHEAALRDMKSQLEAEGADRDNILKRQIEAEHRAAEYGENTYKLQHLLSSGRGHLEMLFAPQELIDEFDEAHGTYELKPPKSASDADNEDLKSRVEALEEVVESLEARTESDGLFVAIANLCEQRGWQRNNAVQLGRRVVESTTDQAEMQLMRKNSYMARGALPSIPFHLITNFLTTYEVRYTPEAMAYLLQAMGTSTADVELGFEMIDPDDFVNAFNENANAPEIRVVSSLEVEETTSPRPPPQLLRRAPSNTRLAKKVEEEEYVAPRRL